MISAQVPPKGSARDYLDALVWDKRPRIDRWLVDYAGAPDTEYVRGVSRGMLVTAVRRARHPGSSCDEMVVLVSPPGTGKTSALRILAVSDDWFTDDLPLGGDARRLVEATAGKWIVEAGELKGMSKSDQAALKACLSHRHDVVRLPYAQKSSLVLRHFMVVGTANETDGYLRDATGNRRFWPVPIVRFDLPRLLADRDQLWAEAAEAEAEALVAANRSSYDIAPDIEDPIKSGQDHAMLKSLAAAMRFRGSSYDEIEAALLAANKARCDPPKPDSEVRSIARRAAEQPTSTQYTIVGTSGQADDPLLDDKRRFWPNIVDDLIVDDPIVDVLHRALGSRTGKLRVTDAYLICGMEPGRVNQDQMERLGRAIRELGWEHLRRRINGELTYAYVKGTPEQREVDLVVEYDPPTHRMKIRDGAAKLFVVYLGGKVAEGRMGEDHEVVVVVAPDVPSARKAAKAKWRGLGDPRVDAVQELDVVDGHQVDLSPVVGSREDHAPVDATWVP